MPQFALVYDVRFDPPMAVAVMNPQDGFDDDLIGRVPLLTPASVGEGARESRRGK